MASKFRNNFGPKRFGHNYRVPAHTKFPMRALPLLLLTLAVLLAAAQVSTAQTLASPEGESHYAIVDAGKKMRLRVHYKNYGKGNEAIVFIHGWTCNQDYWRDQVAEFSKWNRVIALDLPGHGKSDQPQIAYSMELFARAVNAVLRDANIERAVLVGHSMGTPVARQFYRNYPKKTAGIVIVDGPLRPFGDKQMMDRLIGGFRGAKHREVMQQMFVGMMGPNISPETRSRINSTCLSVPQYVAVSAMEGMADDSIWGEDKINVPVLAIMAKSPFFGADIEQRYRAIAPNLEFHMWDGVGHFLMMEKPKQFNDEMLAFLSKNALLRK
ncbi:MAG: alpha/beta hydrolase [Acidobacteriota bacterium]|nr:alpha/beta hydrolase [Acidobacteriota bacterium]